jgi:hypothetical protein
VRASRKRFRLHRSLLLLPLIYVIGVNYAVRRFGGDPHPLSVLRMSEKTSALARLGLHSVRHLWSDACEDTEGFVRAAARAEGIPVSFALAIARAESGFRSHSISSTGAMGVMQLMPATASRHGVIDPFNPEDNARGAAHYLRSLWDRYHGDRRRVAAAYNAGEGLVPRRGQLRVPSATLGYAAQVVKLDRHKGPVDCLTEPLVISADAR